MVWTTRSGFELPFDASLAGVRALLPHRQILDEPPTRPQHGETYTTVEQVETWLIEYAGEVRAVVGDYELLAGMTDLWRTMITTRAAGLVHTAAASAAEAAGHPERQGKSDESYSTVLWNRYLRGLERLDADIVKARTVSAADPDGAGGAPGRPVWHGPPAGSLLTGAVRRAPNAIDHVDRRRPYR